MEVRGKGVWLSYSRARPESREKAVDVLVDDHVCMLEDMRLYQQQQQIFVGRPPSGGQGGGSVAFLQQGAAREQRKGCRCVGRRSRVYVGGYEIVSTTAPCWTTP